MSAGCIEAIVKGALREATREAIVDALKNFGIRAEMGTHIGNAVMRHMPNSMYDDIFNDLAKAWVIENRMMAQGWLDSFRRQEEELNNGGDRE